MSGEGGGGDEEEEDEGEGGMAYMLKGEEKPEPEPEYVPPESCPVLMVFASPGEFIDKLMKIINELTSVLKERKSPGAKKGDEDLGDEEGEMNNDDVASLGEK
ncbi:unnamed protein product [Leptidea sinapis]|uniref:Uncharacterized protein n=1 Tax=Leptidea sinapis TaxID=189913 RepID=A0A5E4QYZ1_9NEOP|nr:unnamed protein product [Leptidea sinapis]